jgi:hypothetical protein
MLCSVTLSYIAIVLAYMIVSYGGYRNIPGPLFLLGSVIIGLLLHGACAMVGDVFAWGILVIIGILFYIISTGLSWPSSGGDSPNQDDTGCCCQKPDPCKKKNCCPPKPRCNPCLLGKSM